MNNDLESLFRSSFNDENISEEDWNIPSDKVWAGVEEDLTQKKKKRFGFFWMLPFVITSGLFALFLLSEMVFNNQKNQQNNISNQVKTTTEIKTVVNPITDMKTSNNVIFENKKIDNKKIESTANQSVVKEKPNKQIVFSKNKNSNTSYSFEKKSISNQTPSTIFVEENKNNTNINTVLPIGTISTEEGVVLSAEKTSNTAIVEKRIATETLELLPQDFKYLTIPELNVNIASAYASKLDFSSLKKASAKSILDYAVILSAQNFIFQNKISSNDKVDFSGEKFNLAYSYGISTAKMIGQHTFLSLGLQQSEIRYSLNYDVALPFNPQGETPNINGNFDNKYSGAIPTSQGELKMEMVLQRQAQQTVVQGEAIPLSASGMEKLKFVRIPLSIGANFFTIGKFQIINQLSFNQMINVSSETTFQSVLSHHDAVQETQTVVRLSPKPSKWTPEIGTSLGFYYPLTKKIHLGAEGFLNQSLRPMYKNTSYSNTPISYGIGANLKYKF
jgi:hypothetical protein